MNVAAILKLKGRTVVTTTADRSMLDVAKLLAQHGIASASGAAGFFLVMLGQTAEYWRLRSSHFSMPGSVSGLMASTGHSGSHTPQSMHSSG
jgi:hypothetical protein